MENIQSQTFFNLLLFLGDNVYNDGNPAEIGKKLFTLYETLKNKGVEIRGIVGNHDVQKYIDGEKIQQCYFGMGENTFYSFPKNANLIIFFGLDSNILVDYQPTKYTLKTKPDQNNWLTATLGNTSSKWNVVFMHHPVYSSSHRHGVFSTKPDDIAEYKAARQLEDIIKPKVKLVLVGHAHAHEHIVPQSGVHYFVSGSGAKAEKEDADNKADFHKCSKVEKMSCMLFSVKPDAITFGRLTKIKRSSMPESFSKVKKIC